MRALVVAAIFAAPLVSPGIASADVPAQLLPPLGSSRTYVVTETRSDIANGQMPPVTETVKLSALAGPTFDVLINAGTNERRLSVKPGSNGSLDANGTAIGATFWAQDLNAVIQLFSGRDANLASGAHWTTEATSDITAITVPDMHRQTGTAPLLVPLNVTVTASATGFVIEGASNDDRGNSAPGAPAVTVKITANYDLSGRFVQAEGSVTDALVAGTPPLFTRTWTVR